MTHVHAEPAFLVFQVGKPARRSFERFSVSVDPIWTGAGTPEHLVTVFTGYPPPAWVGRMSWQVESYDSRTGSTGPPVHRYRPDARGQFLIKLDPEQPAALFVLSLRPATEVRREQLACCAQEQRLEDAAALLREALSELSEAGAALTDAPGRVLETLLDSLPGPSWRLQSTTARLFLLEAAGVAWLDWLADAATAARRKPLSEDRRQTLGWTLNGARADPDGLLARSEAWEELAGNDPAAARLYVLVELAGRTLTEVESLLSVASGALVSDLAQARRAVEGATETVAANPPDAKVLVPAPAVPAGSPLSETAEPRGWRILDVAPWLMLAASVLILIGYGLYSWMHPGPTAAEVGCTPANLMAAARLDTPKELYNRLAKLLDDGRRLRERQGLSLRESVTGARRDCKAIIDLLNDRPTPLSPAARDELLVRCHAWDEEYENLLGDLDRDPEHPDGSPALRARAVREFDDFLSLLHNLANQKSS